MFIVNFFAETKLLLTQQVTTKTHKPLLLHISFFRIPQANRIKQHQIVTRSKEEKEEEQIQTAIKPCRVSDPKRLARHTESDRARRKNCQPGSD